MKPYKDWMEDFISINNNPSLDMVGMPLERTKYYKKYFPKDFDPMEVYLQYKRIE